MNDENVAIDGGISAATAIPQQPLEEVTAAAAAIEEEELAALIVKRRRSTKQASKASSRAEAKVWCNDLSNQHFKLPFKVGIDLRRNRWAAMRGAGASSLTSLSVDEIVLELNQKYKNQRTEASNASIYF